MPFKPGQSGNPNGRPKNSGRLARARAIILQIFEDNKDIFQEKMKEAFFKNPIGYYLKFIAPFMPKEWEDIDDTEKKEEIKIIIKDKFVTKKSKKRKKYE